MAATHYQELLDALPIAIWEEDFSAVKDTLDGLRGEFGQNLHGYLESRPDLIRQLASQVKILNINQNALEIYGASTKEELLVHLDKIFVDASFKTFLHELVQIDAGENQVEFRAPNRTLDGRVIFVELRCVVPEQYRDSWAKILVTTVDVTKQHLGELALQKSEERFRLFYRNAPLAYQSLDAAGRFLDVNPAFEKLLGYTREELIGTRVSRLLTADSRKLLTGRFCGFMESGSITDAEFTMRHKNGSLVEVTVTGKTGQDSEGRFVQTHCILTDVTQQKRNRQELLKRERSYRQLYEQFRILFDGIPDVLLLLTPEARLSWANQSATLACGVPVENMIGKNCRQLMQEHAAPCDESLTDRCIHLGETGSSLVTTSDGRSWGVRVFPIRAEDGTVTQVMELAHDVTEKIKLQAETMRTGHLAALGELAAGVAHEINNPINGIINYAQILINQGKKNDQKVDIAERIVTEGDRIATIVGNLLSFSRDRVEEKRPVVLNDLLREALSLCETRLKKDGIALELDLAEGLPCLLGKYQKLEQVFINLISNAQHALNEKYPNAEPDKKLVISAHPRAEPHVMEIVFHDFGCGIPSGIMDRILNPFFSTKPHGEGTGLGLSISHGIIQEHDGSITIESQHGAYTKVILTLPLAG